MRMFKQTPHPAFRIKGESRLSMATLLTGVLVVLSIAANATPPRWVSFEDDESPPFFGFEAQDRGGTLGLTSGISRDATPALFGQYSAYLSEAWDRVSLPVDITEGLVQVWFYDDNYGAGTPGTQTMSNSIRLRSEADDPARAPGWPLHYLCVDLRGEFVGHGRSGFYPYYIIAKPGTPGVGMGVDFGRPVGSASAEVFRATESWNLVTFEIDSGITTVAVNGEMVSIVETHPLTSLELLCRSGWFQTRGGEARVMRWDGIAVFPKIYRSNFSSTPDWMTFASGSALIFDSTRVGQTVPFDFIPGSSQVARFPSGGQKMSCPWRTSEGAIEIWYWDNLADEGGNPDNGSIDVIVYSDSSPQNFIRMRTFESVMGSPTDNWFLVTPQSPAGMGGAHRLTRRRGWNQMVFHRTANCLYVSLNGKLVSDVRYRWDSPPDDLVLEISSRPGYNDGFPLWLGRISITGEGTTSVGDWKFYR